MTKWDWLASAIGGLVLSFAIWGLWDAVAQTMPHPCASTLSILDAYAAQVARLQVQLIDVQAELTAARKAMTPGPELKK